MITERLESEKKLLVQMLTWGLQTLVQNGLAVMTERLESEKKLLVPLQTLSRASSLVQNGLAVMKGCNPLLVPLQTLSRLQTVVQNGLAIMTKKLESEKKLLVLIHEMSKFD